MSELSQENKKTIDIFRNSLSELGIKTTDELIDRFLVFHDILTKKNEVLNLTAIKDFEGIFIKHFYDSLSFLKLPVVKRIFLEQRDELSSLKLLDLGTGAGFPGIPIKIVFPEINITFVDSVEKKLRFIDEVLSSPQFSGGHYSLAHFRAEDLGHDLQYRGKYDIVVSRAVANYSTLLEYALPLVSEKGFFISYKGSHADTEREIDAAANALKVLNGKVSDVLKFSLPCEAGERTLILSELSGNVPKKYPRKAGTPSKEPL